MDKRRLGALIFTLTLAVTTLGICISISSTARAPGLDPRVYVESHATATAIALVNEPTVVYLTVVQPTLVAEEAKQIKETTKRKYERARDWDDFVVKCKKAVVGGLTIFTAIAQASGAGALVGAVLCYIIERVKRAKDYEPVQRLPEGAILYPRKQIAANTLTGASWKITTEYPASIDHGTLLIEARTGPRFRVAGRNGERHPIVLEALRSG